MKKNFYIVLILVSLQIQAQTPSKRWTGAVDTNWENPGNWNPMGVPTSEYSISIPVAPANQPTLNTLATLRGIYLYGTLTIGVTGSLLLNGDTNDTFTLNLEGATLINNGNLSVENADIGPGIPLQIFLFGDSQIINNGTMTSEYTQFFTFADFTSNNSIINNGTGIIRLSGAVVTSPMLTLRGTNGSLTNRGLFESTTGGVLFNFVGPDMTVINSGTMRTNSNRFPALQNSAYTITNEACGQIDLGSANVTVNGSIINNGLIQTTGSITNTGTFSNVGVLKASSFTNFTNFGLQISSTVTHPNPIFAYGDGNNYSVDDIYTDEAATTLAGTFTGTNTFTPNSTATTLYALVDNGTCSFSVPFSYNPSPFPVKLLEFTGGSGPTSILMQWSTSEETANKGFEIMRSTNSKSWERIGYVAGSGDSKSTKSYDFEDLAPKMGINYYRLRQLDLDGGNEESRIIAVRFLGENAFMVYPNPVENDLSIRMPAGTDIQKVQVLNAAGQPMNVNLNPAYGLSLATLPSGLYFVEVQTLDGGRFMEKIIKK